MPLMRVWYHQVLTFELTSQHCAQGTDRLLQMLEQQQRVQTSPSAAATSLPAGNGQQYGQLPSQQVSRLPPALLSPPSEHAVHEP